MGVPGYGVSARGGPPEHLPQYDDTDAPINDEAYETLIAGGIDEMMARYAFKANISYSCVQTSSSPE